VSNMKSRIIIGCDQLGGQDWGKLNQEDSIDAIQYALEQGFTRFDTADVYGLGNSEVRLGTLINRYRQEIEVNTKIGVAWTYDSGSRSRQLTRRDTTVEYLNTAVQRSKERIGALNKYNLYLHWPENDTNWYQVSELFAGLKNSGVIHRYGLSNYDLSPTLPSIVIGDGGWSLFQRRGSLIDTMCEIDTVLLSKGARLCLYGVYAQGILAKKYDWKSLKTEDRRKRLPYYNGEQLTEVLRFVKKAKKFSHSIGVSLATLILRLTLDEYPRHDLIVGVSKKRHVDDIVSALHMQPLCVDFRNI
jgi:aryl-alcohol dehydrogenase-like predicted oxidoreductase